MVLNDLFLRIPMAWMAEINDLASFKGLPPEGVRAFNSHYDFAERQAIIRALERALADEGFDFERLMVPMQGRPPPANAQMRAFLAKVLRSLKS